MVHYKVFSQSLTAMSDVLRRDIFDLGALGYPIKQIEQPKPDPLAALRYSCIHWIDHLCEYISNSLTYDKRILMSGGVVDGFMRKEYLYWLEAVSLCMSMSKSVVSMSRLEALIKVIPYQPIPYNAVIDNQDRGERLHPRQWKLFETQTDSSCTINRQLRVVHSRHIARFCLVQLAASYGHYSKMKSHGA